MQDLKITIAASLALPVDQAVYKICINNPNASIEEIAQAIDEVTRETAAALKAAVKTFRGG